MTKEKRLIATNKTEEEKDRLTEVWKKTYRIRERLFGNDRRTNSRKSEITGRLHAIWPCHYRILQTER